MNERRSFYRKIGYIVAICVLAIPVSLLSQPASLDANGNRKPGGELSQRRDEYRLSQASLGEIDPASETMRLASLGFQSVATQLLWDKAMEYQKTEDWMSLKAVLDQITRLQPNFFSVWDFQGHNLSYNISVEFDDYRDRFYWVMEGIEFLERGAKFNATDPRFLARIGWVYCQKIARSDERVQYRRLFRKRQEEKGEKLTDNWLVGHDWYTKAQALVKSGQPLRVYIGGMQGVKAQRGEKGPSPLLFNSDAAMALINYADNLELEGTFGDTAKAAWERAQAEWREFSNMQIPTSFGYRVRLADLENNREELKKLQNQIEELLPGERKKREDEKLAALSKEERAALAKPAEERTIDDNALAGPAEVKAKVTWEEIALLAPADKRNEARRLASEIADLEQINSLIENYRGIVNYDYWWTRCLAEPTNACLEARELLFQAGQTYEDGKLEEARELLEQSFAQRRIVLDDFPILRENNVMVGDLIDEIARYRELLGKLQKKFPEKFVLQDVLDRNEGKLTEAEITEKYRFQYEKAKQQRGTGDQPVENAATPKSEKSTEEKSLPANDKLQPADVPPPKESKPEQKSEPQSEPKSDAPK